MLQAAYGGYILVDEGTTDYVDILNYYEPGFNLMSPLEMSIPKVDRLFILIRKRSDETGDNFENLEYTDVSVTAVDATNGESLSVITSNNNVYTPWNQNPSANTPILLQIDSQLDIVDPILRVRVIDCKVKDLTDDNFINFRVVVDDDPTSLYFNYIPVHRKIYSDRNTFTIAGRQAYIKMRSESDAYILVSPCAWLKEVTKDKFDFSYPPDTFYYQREDTYNKEDFIFSLSEWSHSFITENVSVLNIPSYKKVAVILIDNAIYENIKKTRGGVSLTMSITGELSGIEDTFIINFAT